MKLEFSHKPDGSLAILGTMDIYAADDLRAQLTQDLDSPKGVSLDLSGVDSCDVTGLQLLVATRKSAAEAGKSFQITAASTAFEEARAALGIPAETFANNQSH